MRKLLHWFKMKRHQEPGTGIPRSAEDANAMSAEPLPTSTEQEVQASGQESQPHPEPRLLPGWYPLTSQNEHDPQLGDLSWIHEKSERVEDYQALWNGNTWEDVRKSELSEVYLKPLSAIDFNFDTFSNEIISTVLESPGIDHKDNYRIVDYLSAFPDSYSQIPLDYEFDSMHLNRWRKFYLGKGLPNPGLRFASIRTSTDRLWLSPNGLEVGKHAGGSILSKEFSGWNNNRGVRGVISLDLDELSFDDPELWFEYKLHRWVPVELATKPIFPAYDGLTPPESFVFSEAIAYILDCFPVPAGNLNADELIELRNHLLTIHRPVPANLGAAKDESVRARCRDLLQASAWNPQAPIFTVHGMPRLSLLSAEAIRETYNSAAPMLPLPRMVKTYTEAEEYAGEVMEALGFTHVVVSSPGADEGIDVSSDEALAQVKMEGVRTSREKIQRLTGVSSVYGKRAVFFSLSGYSAPAIEWSEKTKTACFEFELDGSVTPRSSAAKELMDMGSSAFR